MSPEALRLYEENKGLVYEALKRLRLPKDPDLVQEGNLALCIAAEKFDPTKGFKFSTYAISFIKGRITTYKTTKFPSISPKKKRTKIKEGYTFANTISMQECIRNEDETEVPIEDTIESDHYEKILEAVEMRDFLSTLTKKELQVLGELLKDHGQRAASKEMGCSQMYVFVVLSQIRTKYRNYHEVDKEL